MDRMFFDPARRVWFTSRKHGACCYQSGTYPRNIYGNRWAYYGFVNALSAHSPSASNSKASNPLLEFVSWGTHFKFTSKVQHPRVPVVIVVSVVVVVIHLFGCWDEELRVHFRSAQPRSLRRQFRFRG